MSQASTDRAAERQATVEWVSASTGVHRPGASPLPKARRQPTRAEQHALDIGIRIGVHRGFLVGLVVGGATGFFIAVLIFALRRVL